VTAAAHRWHQQQIRRGTAPARSGSTQVAPAADKEGDSTSKERQQKRNCPKGGRSQTQQENRSKEEPHHKTQQENRSKEGLHHKLSKRIRSKQGRTKNSARE